MAIITTKNTLENIAHQAQGVKKSSLMFTASLIMAALAYGDERSSEAATAIRSAVISAGMWKDDKGTKQPSNKARRFMKATEAVMKLHQNKAASLVAQASDIPAATLALADWLNTFALSSNHYEGGVYLMPLTLGISKAEARKRIATHASDNASEGSEEKITPVKEAGKKSKAQGAAPTPAQVLPVTMQAKAFFPALATLAKQKESDETSAAIVRLFSELETVTRLLRGEAVDNASKEAKALVKAVAKHTGYTIRRAKLASKAKDAGKQVKPSQKKAA